MELFKINYPKEQILDRIYQHSQHVLYIYDHDSPLFFGRKEKFNNNLEHPFL